MRNLGKSVLGIACMATICFGAQARADIYLDFSSPITLSGSSGPGLWDVDRYAPNGFASMVNFAGGDRLQQSIRSIDAQANNFRNTQGRSYLMEDGTYAASIDVYVDDAWRDDASDRRYAGFWGVGVDAADAVAAYPILEVSRYADGFGVYAWDTTAGAFQLALDLGAATLDSFYNLALRLDGSDFVYSVNGVDVASTDAMGSLALERIILQGYNTTAGVNYEIYWDNLRGANAVVPEPASVVSAATALGLAGLVAARRRRRAASA